MIDFYLIHKIFIFLINIIGIYLCFLVYSNNPKSKISKFFILMMISMFFWVNFAYLARITDYTQLSLVFLKIAWLVTPLLFLFLYFFTVHLIKEEKKYRTLSKIVLFLGIVIAVVTGLTDLIINGVRFVSGDLIIIYGKGMIPFLVVIFLLICATIYSLFKKYSTISAREKTKIQYFLIGIFIFYLANTIFNIVLPLLFNIVCFYYIGDYSTIIFFILTAYAITKHELMGVKTLITQILIAIISIILLVDLFLLSDNLTMQLLKAGILAAFLYFSRGMVESVKKEKRARRELEKLNLKLKKANQRLEGLIEMKNEFLHITSHQLRTPLTAIRGMISMWYEGSFDHLSKGKKKEILKNICISAERLNNITNDMLNSVELEGGVFDFQFKQVSLEKVIKESINIMKFNYDKKELYLNFDAKNKKIPMIEAEPSYVRQIFLNLIDNACKYTNKGGVDIDARKSGKYAEITIKDTGIGVSKRDQKKIFQKFTRSKEAMIENAAGSGLGLFIVEKVVKAHYGKVEFYSEGKGKGSTVKVYLPIKQE